MPVVSSEAAQETAVAASNQVLAREEAVEVLVAVCLEAWELGVDTLANRPDVEGKVVAPTVASMVEALEEADLQAPPLMV